MEIDVAILRERLDYNPETGELTWKHRDVSTFEPSDKRSAEWLAKAWNAKWAGKPAFTADKDGYKVGAVNGINMRAHRVAWAVYHGAWPDRFLDHENGKRADNRIVNLKQADDQQNMRNTGMQKNNTTGVMGVCWCKQTNSWRAMIGVDYKTKCLGRYNRLDDAIVARKLAEKKYGFHENHGTCIRPIQNS